MDAAVGAAAAAFTSWRATTPAERSALMLRFADAVERSAGDLAAVECADTGKPLRSFVEEELLPTVDQLRFFAGAARLGEGRAADEYLAGFTSFVRRQPVGVCAQITPWNFPLMTAVWKIAPALAAGNTTVVKPAETTPRSTLRLAEIAAQFFPPGVVNVVCGDRSTGRSLVQHPVPAMVSFTGSTRAGREVGAAAGGGLKRLHLELGGNAATVVFEDADLEHAADEIAAAAFGNAGQDCVAASRVLVDRGAHDKLVELLVRRADALVVAGPTDPAADLGPLNNADQLDRVRGLVDRLPPSAEVLVGGHRVGDLGYFWAPTVVTGLRQDDEIVQEEVFGPVVTVQGFDGEEDALAMANGVDHGLAASVWTSNHGRAMRFAAALDFGCVWLNTHLRFAAEMPHGGFKQSGYGKDLSTYALDDYTRVKHVMSSLA